MARTIEVILPAAATPTRELLLAQLPQLRGVLGLAVQADASQQPAGDIITLQVSNNATRPVFRLLAAHRVIAQGGTVTTSELKSLLLENGRELVAHETSETVWEEISSLFQQQADLSINFMVMMLLSGGVAAVGFWSNQAGLIYAAQLLAPHFEALLRIPFGLVSGSATAARQGLLATLAGYGLLATGAALTWLLLAALDPATPAALSRHQPLVSQFSVVTPAFVVVSVLGAIVGAFILTTQRSILLSGVYLALSLVPSMALAAIALVQGDSNVARQAFGAWLLSALAVLLLGGLVLGLKQAFEHRRRVLA